MSTFRDGDAIVLRCQGKFAGNYWLDGNTIYGTVALAPDTSFPAHSGTWWRVRDLGNDIVQVECMGHIPGGSRWLDGRTADNTVGLAPTTDLGRYPGTAWKVTPADDNILLECMAEPVGEKRWLDGRTMDGSVGLAPDTNSAWFSGTAWKTISAIQTVLPSVDLAVRVRTERIGQATGSRDPQDWILVNGDTNVAWAVPGTDLGASVMHRDDGHLYVFFGDVPISFPNHDTQFNKLIARTRAPEVERVITEQNMYAGGGIRLSRITIHFEVEGPIGELQRNETPTGAFSYNGRVYVFVLAGRPNGAFTPGSHLVSSADPGQPGPYRYEFLMSAFDQNVTKRGFHNVAPCVIKNADHPELPKHDGDGLVMFGHGFNTSSQTEAIHLAWMPLETRVNPVRGQVEGGPKLEEIRYYTGHPSNPWSQNANDAVAVFWMKRQVAWISAAWLEEAGVWVLMHSTSNDQDALEAPIVARIGNSLWDWSSEIALFDPRREQAYGNYMHWPGVDDIPKRVGPEDPAGYDQAGHAYGAYLLDGFSNWTPETRTLDLFYLMSTWAPYQVQVMHSILTLPQEEGRSFKPRRRFSRIA
jgi:hypothetical protein